MLAKVAALGIGSGSKGSRLVPVQRQPTPWVRPADWSALPAVNSGDQKFVGLAAIYPGDSNNISLTCAAAYTVDWGDGSAPANFATGVNATKNITFASVSSGTLTSEGYRQAIITVTPQAGNNLTSVNLNLATIGATTQWLDIKMAGAFISTCTISGTTGGARMLQQFEFVGPSNITSTAPKLDGARVLRSVIGTAWTATATTVSGMFNACSSLQTVPLLDTHSCTNMSSMFSNCSGLLQVPKFDTSAATNMSQMFSNCTSLQTIPMFNTALVTTMSAMFNGCVSLREVPLLNTGSVTTFAQMFQSCSGLREIPKFNTGAATIMSDMFSGCSSLWTIPLLNTAANQTFNSMFLNCTSLDSIPLLDTGLGTNFTSMFNGCANLKTIPLLDTDHGTNFTTMFNGCTNLQSVPLIDTHLGVAMSAMFASCVSLPTIPLLDMSANLNFSSMFSVCSSLTMIPLLNCSAGTNFSSMFNGCPSLQVAAINCSKTISFAQCELNATQLDAVYTALASGVTGQTVTVTSNPGIGGDTPSIATAKGWTVTGS